MIHWHYIVWLIAGACFLAALLGYFATGMMSRPVTREDMKFPRTALLVAVVLVLITLAGCTTPAQPGVEVRTVAVPTPVPCVEAAQMPTPTPESELTGHAQVDAAILKAENLDLRAENGELRALIDPACLVPAAP